MNKKIWVLIICIVFCLVISITSVSAIDNSSSDKLNVIDDSNSIDDLGVVENEDLSDNLGVCEKSSDELLSVSTDSSEILSSSVSVSSGHTFHKNGYTFKVSANQYKKIKDAVKAGKKHKLLDWGFDFTVKTNKEVKVKVLVKKQTIYKKVRYEGLTKYPYKGIKLVNLKNYYNNGWKKYDMGFEDAKNSKKYLGYNYVKLKKTVKTYKTVKMRVYANIAYVGKYDYVTGEQAFYPWISYEAKKSGYPTKYLNGDLLTYY